MKKRIKIRKKKNLKYIKTMFLLLLVSISFMITHNYLKTIKIYSSNEEFIKFLLNNSNHHLKNNNNLFDKITTLLSNININKPVTILENSFYYKYNDNTELVYNDDYNPD